MKQKMRPECFRKLESWSVRELKHKHIHTTPILFSKPKHKRHYSLHYYVIILIFILILLKVWLNKH